MRRQRRWGLIGVALLLMTPAVIFGGLAHPSPLRSVPVLVAIGYIATFASAIAFLLWSYGVAQLGAGRAAQFVQLMPVFGAILAVVLLGEVLTATELGGAVLVLSGIAIVERRPRQNRGSAVKPSLQGS
jgi:drug/metabolite transporter (DMT)-like permease